MHRFGTVANIVRYVTAQDGTHHLVAQGDQHFQVIEFLNGWSFFVARVLRIPEPDTRSPEIEARADCHGRSWLSAPHPAAGASDRQRPGRAALWNGNGRGAVHIGPLTG